MIIGVDAGALSISDERLRVGVWRVSYNLLRELAKIDKTNEYRLYTFCPIDREVMAAFGPKMKNVVVRPTFAWSTIQLPIELRRHPVDVFLGLSQMLPRLPSLRSGVGGQAHSPSFSIGFIYDLGFLHYPDAYPGSLSKLEKMTRQLVDRADQIIAISDVTKKDILRQYKTEKPIIVAHPGVDARFTAGGPKHKEKNPYVLFVGALKRGKNVPLALHIFKKLLLRSKKKYDFIIVGGNYWEDPEIKETIHDLELKDRVKLVGFVSDTDLPSYYRGAEALLVTSRWEGFCLPAVEAMACGCPVVYVKNGSLPEIVGTAGTGFEPGDEDAAVESLLRKKSVAAGIQRAKRFAWTGFARTVYGIITSR